jgi:peptide-methionine (S)-S-oxide reductase
MNAGNLDMEMTMPSEIATLGGGCFWCLEAVFEQLQGVTKVLSGYAGGATENPSYREVCTGTTDHAEVVQVTFDPAILSYRDLLGVFFSMHDPTTLNRQGADVGTQYRSVIYYHSPEQEKTARDVVAELTAERVWDRPIVTQIEPAPVFYPAEAYHQGYYRGNPREGYCQYVIAPKLAKFRKMFTEKMKVEG